MGVDMRYYAVTAHIILAGAMSPVAIEIEGESE